MKWFGWKSGRGEARPALMRSAFGYVGVASPPASYEQQVRAAYLGNAIAQRAVRIVAEGCAGVALTGDEQVRALIAATSGGQALIETVAMQLLLHGNAYVQIGCDADGLPAELYALRPERVEVEPDARGWPVAYRYRAGEAVTRIAGQDGAGRAGLVHIRSAHPLDDHYGLGCLGAAAGAIAIHNAAQAWNKALLDNAARPSGALVYDPGEPGAALSPDQFDRLRAEMEASFAGAGNAGRPMLLEGGLRWQPISLTPAELDFVGAKASAAREIALAFGVPPLLLGLPGDNTHANYAEANRALWRSTILPLTQRITGAIGEGLAGWWPEARIAVDLDAVPALAAERAMLWGQVAAADFLTRDEKRAMVGLAAEG
ncbi:phage portal protein [Sphingomonas sp. 1P06PA]|uniref:phage portal protein n=1 Tax=Sphingomonas sp. 1P06PA TaxID=554121 RepID=UPI0039A5D51C